MPTLGWFKNEKAHIPYLLCSSFELSCRLSGRLNWAIEQGCSVQATIRSGLPIFARRWTRELLL